MTRSNISGDVHEQLWTIAFAEKSQEAFGAALASDVVLEATVLNSPVVGRDLVKATMGNASKIYEHLVFTNEAVNGANRYIEWEARALNGVAFSSVTILKLNDKREISQIAIHHRPLAAMLKFSNELGNRLDGIVDRGHFHRSQN